MQPEPQPEPAALAHGLSVVIPVYRSAATLEALFARLEPALAATGLPFEAIAVDDGSDDGSGERLRELARTRPWLRPVSLMRNYGQHNALLCGVRLARYDRCLTLDDDLQNPPEEIPALLAALGPEADVVYGAPRAQAHGLLRDLASVVTKLAFRASLGVEVAEKISAFRLFRTGLREAFAAYRTPLVNLDVLLTWATRRFTAVEVRHDAREHGVSHYTFRRLVTHALNMMTGFSVRPLQLASLLGFVCAGLGALLLVFVLLRTIVQDCPVQGFPFLASMVAIFSGAQMLVVGILGEYVARIHLRMLDRPAYAVRRGPEEA